MKKHINCFLVRAGLWKVIHSKWEKESQWMIKYNENGQEAPMKLLLTILVSDTTKMEDESRADNPSKSCVTLTWPVSLVAVLQSLQLQILSVLSLRWNDTSFVLTFSGVSFVSTPPYCSPKPIPWVCSSFWHLTFSLNPRRKYLQNQSQQISPTKVNCQWGVSLMPKLFN